MKTTSNSVGKGIAKTAMAIVVTCLRLIGIFISFLFQVAALILTKVATYLDTKTKLKNEHH
jgi:hypothetical protein